MEGDQLHSSERQRVQVFAAHSASVAASDFSSWSQRVGGGVRLLLPHLTTIIIAQRDEIKQIAVPEGVSLPSSLRPPGSHTFFPLPRVFFFHLQRIIYFLHLSETV